MLYRNMEQDRAFDFIKNTPFDFFCLQEVPDGFLARLKTLQYSVSFGLDTEKVDQNGGVLRMYNVVLSTLPAKNTVELLYSDRWTDVPLRTKIFVAIMKPFHFARISQRKGLCADFEIDGKRLKLFCLHLALASPLQRYAEFEEAMIEHDNSINQVVCGDFNILEAPHITILNFFLGGSIFDFLFFRKERVDIEGLFSKYGFTNLLKGKVTHPLSRSQLDHILVSKGFKVVSVSVIKDRFGSDHAPVTAELQVQ